VNHSCMVDYSEVIVVPTTQVLISRITGNLGNRTSGSQYPPACLLRGVIRSPVLNTPCGTRYFLARCFECRTLDQEEEGEGTSHFESKR
jgi:hypothetical protein